VICDCGQHDAQRTGDNLAGPIRKSPRSDSKILAGGDGGYPVDDLPLKAPTREKCRRAAIPEVLDLFIFQ
jgi:hypothetical protein